MALLDWLGFGGGNALDPAGVNAGIGILDPETLKRMQRAAGMSAQDAAAGNPLAVPPNTVRPAPPTPDPVRSLRARQLGRLDPFGRGLNEPLPSRLTGEPQTVPVAPPPINLPSLPSGAGLMPTYIPPSAPMGQGGIGSDYARAPGAVPGILNGGGGGIGSDYARSPMEDRPNGIPSGSGSAPGYAIRELENKPKSGREPAGAPAVGPPGLIDRVNNFLQQHSNLFLGIGAGFGGARSIGQGIGRASAAISEGAKEDIANQGYESSVKMLMDKGMSRADAEAYASQPKLMEQYVQQFQPKYMTVTDAQGVQRLVLVNPGTGTAAAPTGVPPGTPRVSKLEDALKLPRGTVFLDPDGNPRVR